jgi:hypothetical protein
MAKLRVIPFLLHVVDSLSSLGSIHFELEPNFQTSAGKSEGGLPDLTELLPSNSFSTLKSTVATLEKRLAEDQKRSARALRQLKMEYELKLRKSEKDNSRVEHDNSQIASRVTELKQSNVALRRRAAELVKANDVLKLQLNDFASNLSLAQEFAREGLLLSAANASEVQVLVELTELDNSARAASKKQALLSEFGGHSGKVSLVSIFGETHKRSANDIMETLATDFSKLSDEENTSQTMLREAFEKKLSDVMTRHEALLSEQAGLNKTKADAEEVHERLSAAVNHLSKIHNQLLARVKAIKAFGLSLGNPQPSVAAGQVSQNQDSREAVSTKPRSRVASVARRSRSRQAQLGKVKTTPSRSNRSRNRRMILLNASTDGTESAPANFMLNASTDGKESAPANFTLNASTDGMESAPANFMLNASTAGMESAPAKFMLNASTDGMESASANVSGQTHD